MTIPVRAFTLTVLALFATPLVSMAADSIPDRARARPHRPIRSTDRRLRMLLDDGQRNSPTLRALVARLSRSDVVVYLRCDEAAAPIAGGRLTFVSSAGGYRYVVVRMARFARAQQIAIMAHELQHAVEIADTPAIVDGQSLVREYHRMGYVTDSPLPGIAFDTAAAVRVGQQVLKELLPDIDSY